MAYYGEGDNEHPWPMPLPLGTVFDGLTIIDVPFSDAEDDYQPYHYQLSDGSLVWIPIDWKPTVDSGSGAAAAAEDEAIVAGQRERREARKRAAEVRELIGATMDGTAKRTAELSRDAAGQ